MGSGSLDMNKGLLLAGNPGIGKTTLFAKLAQIYAFKIVDCYDMKDYLSKDPDCLRSFFSKKETMDWVDGDEVQGGYLKKTIWDYVFDNLGVEDNNVHLGYGKFLNPMAEIIYNRFRNWEKNGTMSFFITNFDEKYLVKHYGEFIYDRLIGMCNVIEFTGKSQR